MNKLVLMGKLVHVDDKKYIEYVSKSGKSQLLPIVSEVDFADGTWVSFKGKLCTRLVDDVSVRRHKLWFAVGDMHAVSLRGVYLNDYSVDGVVANVGELRETPLTHRVVVDFVIAEGDNYFNCVAFGRSAQMVVNSLKKGSKICVLSAQFNARDYKKNEETRTAYEVVVREFV